MQTILGANGQIAEELTRELYRTYTKNIRLVSRNPKKIHDTDLLFPANLMDPLATEKAVEGSEIAYLTVGLPMDSSMWEEQFPSMMKNVIEACKKHKVKLVFLITRTCTPKRAKFRQKTARSYQQEENQR